ncbi:hypothetical protein PoB_005214400 [Plakobranchus ocellatus]|uniref:Uncharacterized protein n=1 Tax=Plakobranchus ocellatus TaxID=259542 RepID=A0AAV4BZG2_9GAST|nr:hypothetical protein PoB_005214400 [Plakobranchus ocellatus]
MTVKVWLCPQERLLAMLINFSTHHKTEITLGDSQEMDRDGQEIFRRKPEDGREISVLTVFFGKDPCGIYGTSAGGLCEEVVLLHNRVGNYQASYDGSLTQSSLKSQELCSAGSMA